MRSRYLRVGHKRHGPGGPASLGAALLLMLAAPLALAGKPDCNEHPDHPSCAYQYSLRDVWAGYYCDPDLSSCVELEEASPWDGPYGDAHHEWGPEYDDWTENTLSDVPRPCATPGDVYLCNDESAFGGRVSIYVADYTWDHIQGKKKMRPIPEYCDLLTHWLDWDRGGNEPLRYGPHFYAFHENGEGCSTDGCTIQIHHNALPPLNPFYDLTGLPEIMAVDELPDPWMLEVWAETDDVSGAINFPDN